MKNHTDIITWARDCLIVKGYCLQQPPHIVVETPWSTVIRFSTSKKDIYLKQMPACLSLEPKVMQLLAAHCKACVPEVVAINEDLHCFLMKDAGEKLREYLKTNFQPDLLCRAITEFTAIQRATENQLEPFLALGVPDWRLEHFPDLFDQLITHGEFLKADGLTEKELHILWSLRPRISKQCELLSTYDIPETLVQSDFHSNNILIHHGTQKITFIDLGETVITHPFFSLHTFLRQAIIHHGVKECDHVYLRLQDACFKNWSELSKQQLLKGFWLTEKLWPVYSALGFYRLVSSVDLQAFKSHYADRPHRLAGYLRAYIASG